jgi:Xaa-Pro aminopeptidase
MKTAREKVSALRQAMSECGIDAYFVPHADEHQNEYSPAYAERLAWLTGFTGSAGYALITHDRAVMLTDGRYTIQAKQELDSKVFDQGDYTKTHPVDWAIEAMPVGGVFGFDPKIVTHDQAQKFSQRLEAKGMSLKAVTQNLIDPLWLDQPALPKSLVYRLGEEYAGEPFSNKINKIAKKCEADYLLISDLTCVAWLLNLRGQDIDITPVFMAYALLDVTAEKVTLFTDRSRVSEDVLSMQGNALDIREYEEIEGALEMLGTGKRVQLDSSETSEWLYMLLQDNGAEITEQKNPIILAKACKNEAEIDGMKEAHRIDGTALSKFFAWFDAHKDEGIHTETSVEDVLYGYRAESNLFRGISFDPISGFAENGAVIHYRAKEETALTIKGDGLYLLDSGGQYECGTTDLTRTVAVGMPSEEMKRHYTAVLKGHIALARAVFPSGTTGAQLDVLARQYLWEMGLDYAHGTGHGVGMFLNVHEGPAGISARAHEPLAEGMILSNEPGYYEEGSHGIRIENLIQVKKAPEPFADGRDRYYFETISLVPFDRSLMVMDMLEADELTWINEYHQQVYDEISISLNDDEGTLAWLKSVTAPL